MTSNLENLQTNNPNDKEMSLLEHFKELRGRITWMAGAIVIGMGICFTAFGFKLMEFLEEPARKSIPGFTPQATEPLETIVTFFQVGLLGGIAFALSLIHI